MFWSIQQFSDCLYFTPGRMRGGGPSGSALLPSCGAREETGLTKASAACHQLGQCPVNGNNHNSLALLASHATVGPASYPAHLCGSCGWTWGQARRPISPGGTFWLLPAWAVISAGWCQCQLLPVLTVLTVLPKVCVVGLRQDSLPLPSTHLGECITLVVFSLLILPGVK